MRKTTGICKSSCVAGAFAAMLAATFSVSAFDAAAFTSETPLLTGWEFSRGAGKADWKQVKIPHDWAISGPFDKEHDKQVVAIVQDGEKAATEKTGRSGALPWIGEGWYRRTVEIPAGTEYAALQFDAAMSEPEVFWDGAKVGEWKCGYNVFIVDVSDRISGDSEKGGRHLLEVRCNNRGESSRWYPGAGLIRPVRLLTGGKVGIAPWGVSIRTPTLDTWTADVELRNPDGAAVSVTNYVKEGLGPYKPWSPEEPNLYTLVTEVRERGTGSGDKLLDRRETRFGFRTVAVTKRGFELNGEVRKIKGVCLHHDLGVIGAAFNVSAFRRQVEKLKEIGCDAIRTAHNMPAPDQIAVCDEMGVMVMAESFDMWRYPKCKNGYAIFYKDWWRRDLENLVKVNRSSPSVVMWSIGNEIPEQTSKEGLAMTREMQDFVHGLDPTRPVTQGLDRWPWAIKSGVAGEMDITGLNYRLPYYGEARKAAKNSVVLGSETASTVSTRGHYYFPVAEGAAHESPHPDGQCTGYDVECASWSNLPDDDRAMQVDNDWVMGEFVWTGFDYLGEPSPYNEYWPSRSSYFGIFDLAGLPKDRAWLYRSWWRTDDHTLHIVPHWTWPGREGKTTPVYVYTDAPSAELFVNGKSQGVKTKDKAKRLDRFRLRWNDVVYEPGELKVVARYADGTSGYESVKTAGAPAALKLEPERVVLAAPSDGRTPDLGFVTVSVVDADGNVCPDAALPLTFEVKGAAKFRGVCNGDATSLEVFTEPKMTTFHGQLVVVVEPVASGEATLTVRSGSGFESAVLFRSSKLSSF